MLPYKKPGKAHSRYLANNTQGSKNKAHNTTKTYKPSEKVAYKLRL